MKGLKVFYLIIYITEMSNQPSFNELARQSGYKGSAMTKGKLTRNYKSFVARNHGFAPLPTFGRDKGLVYNPLGKQLRTQLVLESTLYKRSATKAQKLKARFKELDMIPTTFGPNQQVVYSDYTSGTLAKQLNQLKENESIPLDRRRIGNDLNRLIKAIAGTPNNIVMAYTDHEGVNKHTTLNRSRLSGILKGLQEDSILADEISESDGRIIEHFSQFTNMRLALPGFKGNTVPESGFFPFTHNFPIELSQRLNLYDAGIFTQVRPENYTDNCLIRALKQAVPKADVETAVMEASITIRDVQQIETRIVTQFVPNRELQKVARMLKRNIKLDSNTNHNGFVWYPTEGSRTCNNLTRVVYPGSPIELATLENHYFLNKKIPITNYAVDHWEDLIDSGVKDWWRVSGKHTPGKGWPKISQVDWAEKKSWTTTYKAVSRLRDDRFTKYWKPIDFTSSLMATSHYNDKSVNRTFSSLEYNRQDIRGVNEPYLNEKEPVSQAKSEVQRILDKHSKTDEHLNFFLDFETLTRETSTGRHTPYLCCVVRETPGLRFDDRCKPLVNNLDRQDYAVVRDRGFTNPDWIAKQVLHWIGEVCKREGCKKARIFAHNMKYDFRFIRNCITQLNTIEPDGRFVVGWGLLEHKSIQKAKVYPIRISLRDSYCMISEPLGKFGKMFALEQQKEVMPYDMYTPKNLDKRWFTLEECLAYLPPQQHDAFTKIVRGAGKKNGFYQRDVTGYKPSQWLVNIMEYAVYYCLLDCEVLRNGWNKFRDQILDVTETMEWCPVKVDINFVNTAAKLAHSIMLLSGVYDNVYMTSGVVQSFCSRAVVGGRTMCSRNEIHVVKDRLIGNSDANSLYPSAMARLPGYLKGKPNVLTPEQTSYAFLQQQSGYIVEVRVDKVGKWRDFPLQSKAVKGVRDFSNRLECPKGKGYTLTMDNYSLEDFLKYQDAEVTILRGYYWNKGYNNRINDVIRYLYSCRLHYKDPKNYNPIEKSYKLLLNSAYGYTLLKPPETETVTLTPKKAQDYIRYNFNYVRDYSYVEGGKYWTISTIKPIHDHFNLSVAGIQVLSMSKRIMNEVMCLAEDLEIPMYYQDTDSIHLDASRTEQLTEAYEKAYSEEPWFQPLYGDQLGQFSSDFEMDGIKEQDIKCVNGVYLGKKCYIELLEGIDSEGKVHYDAHIRMKGVGDKCVTWRCKELGCSPLELYTRLSEPDQGETFDLLRDDKGWAKPKFIFHPDYTISSREEFHRFITFDKNLREKRKKLNHT
tara:strand:+ start:51 stop:3818 length:3768 start_codon:yes stop_codon:yes gene_type:complete